MTDYKQLCAELLSALENEGHAHWPGGPDGDPLIEQARAALAEPKPEPADGDVAELVAWLLDEAVQAANASQPTAAGKLTWAAQLIGEHAELLQRQAPEPEPEGPTDEELNALWNCCGIADEYGHHEGNFFDFARAVLARWGK